MDNISLHYAGGSGGFIGLHVLLETDRYFCSLDGLSFLTDSNFLANFDHLKSQHWGIQNISAWKHTEIWPNNIKTENSTSTRPKIFFHCNYFKPNRNSKTILVYTDIESQLVLAKHKNANWYHDNTTIDKTIRWQEVYYAVKADDWDNTVDLRTDFNSLPNYQQEEILTFQTASTQKELLTEANPPKYVDPAQILHFYKTLDNGIKVHPLVSKFYKKADYCVSLQDLINSDGKALLELLDLPHTNGHINLIDHWKKLHPPELLESIGINSVNRA